MKKRLGLPILMGRPPRGVNLTPTGYVLMDGTPYDPVKRKQENERAKAERKKLRKEHVEDEEQEATVLGGGRGGRGRCGGRRGGHETMYDYNMNLAMEEHLPAPHIIQVPI